MRNEERVCKEKNPRPLKGRKIRGMRVEE